MELLVMVLSETTIPAEFLPPKVPSGVRSGTFAGHPAMPRKDDASACSAKPLGPEPLVSKGLRLQLHFWDRNPFSKPAIPPMHCSLTARTDARIRLTVVGADTHFLPTAIAPQFGRGPVSGAAWTARPRHHRRAGHWVRSGWKFTSPPGYARLFVGVAARHWFDRQPGP